MISKWKKNRTDRVFENGFFDISKHECENESVDISHNFYVINTYDWVNVVAVTPEGKLVMVKQHRLGSDEISLETPGGVIEHEESPADCARRELLEETGYRGSRVTLLNESWVNPAIMSNRISFFLIEGCEKVQEQELDPAEDIDVAEYPLEEVISMIRTGEIDHSIVINTLSMYLVHCATGFDILPSGLSPEV